MLRALQLKERAQLRSLVMNRERSSSYYAGMDNMDPWVTMRTQMRKVALFVLET